MKKTTLLLLLVLLLTACSAPGTPKMETTTLSANSEKTFLKSDLSASAVAEVRVSTQDGVKFFFDGKEAKGVQLSAREYTLLSGLTVRILDSGTLEFKYSEDWEVK